MSIYYRSLLVVWLVPAILGCGQTSETGGQGLPASEKAISSLVDHTTEFRPEVIRVAPGVYQAVGYALANSIMLEGDDGVVIVDVTESVESAQRVLAEFRKITSKPVKALIYTHNHADHVLGGKGFVPEGQVEAYAHESTNTHINRYANLLRTAVSVRSARMFGTYLPEGEEGILNAGIGPSLKQGGHSGGSVGLIRPTQTFDQRLSLNISGLELELIHAPGETEDQIMIWLPKQRILLPGDNIYKAFPNLYTIRGTPHRDVLTWIQSLDRMRELSPLHLVPSHTRAVSGADEVRQLLTVYRDAIQYVHDQTVRGINMGLSPDRLATEVQLPATLREHPWLLEHYGTVPWSVRSIYAGYLGWFDGDAVNLAPEKPSVKAARLIELAGGIDQVISAAEQALEDGDYQWAAELAAVAEAADEGSAAGKQIQATSLRELGYRSRSPNGRHYYLTQALELEGELTLAQEPVDHSQLLFAQNLPMLDILSGMSVQLNPLLAEGINKTLGIVLSDIDEEYVLELRNGIVEVRADDASVAELRLTTTKARWLELLLGVRNPAALLASGDIEIEGGLSKVAELISFLRMFAGD